LTLSRRRRLRLSAELVSTPPRTLERVLSGTMEGTWRTPEMAGGASGKLRF